MPAACPICGRPHELRYRPFCSKRCADIDLGRWLGQRYVIARDDPESAVATPQDDASEEPEGNRARQ